MATKTIGQLTQATTINNGDEFAIEQSGVTKRIAASVVRGDIVNANIKSDAAIAYSKLAPLNSAQILVGNGSNIATAVSVTGDVTISNAGVTAIGSAKVLPAMLAQPYTLATAQNSTSGTSIDFTGIPSWAKRITVMFRNVSLSGSAQPMIRVGRSSGSTIVTSGYAASASFSGQDEASTAGFAVAPSGYTGASNQYQGMVCLLNISGNIWVANGIISVANQTTYCAGSVDAGGTLDTIRVTSTNGTDTFDAGTINIAYEG